MIQENGGEGEFEALAADGTAGPAKRWEFPRFPGADAIGTCASPGAAHEGVHVRTAKGKGKCKDFAHDPGNLYLSRSGSGPYDTDVEMVAGWLEASRNIVGAVLLLGDPGTGKTALVEAAVTHARRPLTTIVCTPDHTKDSLFLRFVGEGKGDCSLHDHTEGQECEGGCHLSAFALGPLPYAVKHGHTLYMDEVMLLMDGLKPILYSLADGRRFLPEGNIDGSPLEIHPDFRLILSSNPMVRGASLPEPLASRTAGTTLTIETDATMLLDLGIDDAIVAAWDALRDEGLWHPQIRELRVADHWFPIDKTQALSAFIGEHCPESQREQIRDKVMSLLGGYIRSDGRMVVK